MRRGMGREGEKVQRERGVSPAGQGSFVSSAAKRANFGAVFLGLGINAKTLVSVCLSSEKQDW